MTFSQVSAILHKELRYSVAFGLGVAEYADDGGVEAEEKFVGLMAAVAG